MWNRWGTRRARLLVLGGGGTLLLLLASAALLRPWLLQQSLARAQQSLQKRYQTTLSWQRARWTGLTEVELLGLTLLPQGADTLLQLDTLRVGLRFWPLGRGQLKLHTLHLSRGHLALCERGTADNFRRFLPSPKARTSPSPTAAAPAAAPVEAAQGWDQRVAHVLDQFFGYLPAEARWEQLTLNLRTRSDTLTARLQRLRIYEGKLQAQWALGEDTFRLGGDFDPIAHALDLRLARQDTGLLPIRYLRDSLGLQLGFSFARVRLVESSEAGALQVQTAMEFRQLRLYHRRLNDRHITFRRLGLDYLLRFGAQTVELDSSSTMTLNEVNARLYARTQTAEDTSYQFRFDTGLLAAQRFFDALPEGICGGLRGLQVAGKLRFALDFAMVSSRPDSLQLEGGLRSYGLRILQMGRAQLTKLNEDFTYYPYRGGRKQIIVGPANYDFVPLAEISPYLKQAVLSSEDAGFYYHQGFYTEAIRKAVAENIKAQRFKRGGSTITMQLVKNVFLTHRKHLARKLEEALMVWLIESQGLCSKDRMLEVYLNIIEWGPNVYGAREAARFYFGRTPTALSPQEAIFLAMIIPQPNAYMYFFDSTARLKPFVEGYFQMLGRKLRQAELLTELELEHFDYDLRLRGRALDRLKLRETGQRPDPQSLESIEQDLDREFGLDLNDL